MAQLLYNKMATVLQNPNIKWATGLKNSNNDVSSTSEEQLLPMALAIRDGTII